MPTFMLAAFAAVIGGTALVIALRNAHADLPAATRDRLRRFAPLRLVVPADPDQLRRVRNHAPAVSPTPLVEIPRQLTVAEIAGRVATLLTDPPAPIVVDAATAPLPIVTRAPSAIDPVVGRHAVDSPTAMMSAVGRGPRHAGPRSAVVLSVGR